MNSQIGISSIHIAESGLNLTDADPQFVCNPSARADAQTYRPYESGCGAAKKVTLGGPA